VLDGIARQARTADRGPAVVDRTGALTFRRLHTASTA